ILRVGQIEMGRGQNPRLVMIIHHLTVDGVSWRILLEDLERGYRQLRGGESIRLGHKTTSWQYWARRIKQYSHEEMVKQGISYWASQANRENMRVPVDYPAGDNTVRSMRFVEVSLSEKETKSLLLEAPQAYQTQIHELLMAALVATLRRWTGSRT